MYIYIYYLFLFAEWFQEVQENLQATEVDCRRCKFH